MRHFSQFRKDQLTTLAGLMQASNSHPARGIYTSLPGFRPLQFEVLWVWFSSFWNQGTTKNRRRPFCRRCRNRHVGEKTLPEDEKKALMQQLPTGTCRVTVDREAVL
ncbi:hypothetical protein [Serratia ficaria]|uniref:hypothetical protein n=1 Tax=Serratia ficaria TaxID=61651 RepID=UPI0021C7918A|nr:hypothetical protein [Serratia ficaria]